MRFFERYRLTLILLIVAIIIGGTYFLFLRPLINEARRAADFEKHFFRADPGIIKLIRLNTGQGPIDVVRKGHGWLVAGKYRADEGTMERLLETLSQGRLIKVVGDGAERGRFGFDDPGIVISIGFNDGRIDAIEVAGKNPAGTGYYAYGRTLEKIFLVNDGFAREMKLNLFELRDKRLFPFDPDTPYSLSITAHDYALKLIKDNKGWSMKKPFSARCDTEAVDGFLNSLSIHRAKGFLPWKAQYSKLKNISLNIRDVKGAVLINADTYFWGSQMGRGVLVAHSGSDEAARTGRDLWNILNTDPSAFLIRKLFDIDVNAVTKIRLLWKDNTHTFKKQENNWTGNGKRIGADKMDKLLDSLLSWNARKLVARRQILGKEQMVIEITGGGKNNKVIISTINMDRQVSPTGLMAPEGDNQEKFRKVDFFLASSTALEMSPIVSSLEIEKITSIAEEIEKE